MIKWRGIRWSIHPLFVLIMVASAVTGYFAELITLFIIVLVHEMGHVLVARSLGWTVKEVKLLPFGGVAEVEEAGGASAKEDAIVAIAGPLQNVWMAAAAWGCGAFGIWDAEWAQYVMMANVIIGSFNLLPIHPLDGGKLMQSLLSYFLHYYQALLWTARISLTLSGAMTLSALLPVLLHGEGVQLNLFIIGVFLIASNWTYMRHVPFLFYRFLVQRERLARRLTELGREASPLIVQGGQSVLSVARRFNRERYHLVYVLEPAAKELRVLAEEAIVAGCLSGENPGRAVSELLR
ncbi:M50 family metallopeptidase [Paenibacillus sp. J5C_2022]|uniref:M50 family metallopeptidase n=1 Tax=Paenibacillus sp. J5C2022 TaxID=2977129 RepID=UPI0021CFC4FC|nr:M50 family metallopeptidase [Paenibacillus sp. J5C2022]MCU6711098.1 M50 family metallopeptidase [Paenibacillus sp. J5C2022]